MKWPKFVGILILIGTLFLNLSAEAKEVSCKIFLAEQMEVETALTNTQATIAYLNYLSEQGIVTSKELNDLADSIEHKNVLINPVPDRAGGSAYQIHRENFSYYMTLVDLNMKEVHQWVLELIQKNEQVKEQKKEAENATQQSFIKMKFHRVEKGEFYWGQPIRGLRNYLRTAVHYEKDKKVILTHDIEVMSTPVTQAMWVEEMGVNPSVNKNGASSISINMNGRKIEMQPDNPVETVSWYAAAQFANYMSRKHRLKEVYDFSEVEFDESTSFEEGTLKVKYRPAKQQRIQLVKINGPNIYETEGFRLPTEAEQSFILKDRGRSQTEYFTGITKQNISEHAWGEIQTIAVGEKKPLSIDSNYFYDLYGNVLEWSNDVDEQDDIKDEKKLKNYKHKCGIDPVGHSYSGDIRIVRGMPNKSSCRTYESANMGNNLIGFRLVRTVK